MSDTPSTLETVLTDQEDLLIDDWVDRLINHPDSNFSRDDLPELERICGHGLNASLALLQGRDQPNLKEFVRELTENRSDWDLEGADLLRFFWELRKSVEDLLTQGGDPGRPDWRQLHEELDRCIEVGVFNLVKSIEEDH